MKTLILVFTISFVFAANIFARDTFIKAGNKAANENEIRLISSDAQKTSIEVNINGFYNKRIELSGSVYDNIYLKEFVSLGDAGQASLPVITKMIAIPNYKDVKVVITSSDHQTFGSYDIIPYQTPALRNTNGISDIFKKDNSYYSSNKYYPDNIVSIKEISVMRDYRIAVVTINPVQYNPTTKQVKVYSRINFDLKYEGYSDVNNVTYSVNGLSKSFQAMYKQLIFNYREDNSTFTAAPSMIIIASDSLYNSVQPLSEWKTKKGIKTVIKKTSE
ncbi:MAG: C25 family peptidase propeptide domain-containing protein, partial [Ignavibacteria bacterium]